jgi:GTP-binding protein
MSAKSQTPNVAIVGRPNVGKSALFNRLAGRRIAIVHDQPGITRDRISAVATHRARPFMLWDTGGVLGAGESELMAQVRGGVEEAIRESDLLLFVVDAKGGLLPIDEELAQRLRKTGKPVVLAINKIDNEKHESLAADFDSLGFASSVSISAEHNRGISELVAQIEKLLPSPANIEDRTPIDREPASDIGYALAIAVVGRPNVGKSSFINSILRSRRAIVSELAGTTRDAIDISYRRNGEQFVFIDTAGIRRRSAHSSSVEVFSVMRAERSIRRADLCVLIVDLSSGVTAQDKRIAGLIRKARKPCIIILNKWDLIKPKRGEKAAIAELVDQTRERLFFLSYAQVLVASALTRENVDRLFRLSEEIRGASRERIGTGVLNRRLRAAFASNPPPMVAGKRLKLFYATQSSGIKDQGVAPPEFVLFVNNPRLLSDGYARYLEAQVRKVRSYTGLPIILTLRARKT